MRFWLAAWILIAQVSVAQEEDPLITALSPVEVPSLKKLPQPRDAILAALADANTDPDNARFWRWIWIPNGSSSTKKVADLVLNMCLSRNQSHWQAIRIQDATLLRIDYRVARPEDPEVGMAEWEQLAAKEPYFGIQTILTDQSQVVYITTSACQLRSQKVVLAEVPAGETIKFVSEVTFGGVVWVQCSWGGFSGYIQKEFIASNTFSELGINPLVQTHVGQEALQLAQLCNTRVPIVRWDWFAKKALTTLDGGMYYTFRGIKKSPNKDQSDIDFYLQQNGSSIAEVQKLRADQKTVIFQSQVTGKPRSVLLLQGPSVRPTVAQGLITITQDVADDAIRIDEDPLKNLLTHRYNAIETIIETHNGSPEYALFTGDLNGDGVFDPSQNEGVLQLSAPDNVVRDHTVPRPYTSRLQPAIGCIRCHTSAADMEGWQPLRNDVADLLASNVDIFGERKEQLPNADTIARLAGLYTGDLRKPLDRARDDFSEFVLRVTKGYGDKGFTINEACSILTQEFGEYEYTFVTPMEACTELGYLVENEAMAVQFLRSVLVPQPVDGLGISPEDPWLASLKEGKEIPRLQWELVYLNAAYRVTESLSKKRE